MHFYARAFAIRAVGKSVAVQEQKESQSRQVLGAFGLRRRGLERSQEDLAFCMFKKLARSLHLVIVQLILFIYSRYISLYLL